uniref:Cilia- and flagella-associated protein HOATZ n=1 Tax=Laticauda laticaudata TaxID=8630 RepID=A0A8C5RHF6_LATLA
METNPGEKETPPAMASSPPAPAAAPLPFAGSSEQDVALAKSFWDSVTLQPPLESRLGDGASCPRRSSAGSRENQDHKNQCLFSKGLLIGVAPIHPPPPHHCKHFSLQAKKREDIIALLKKQREERISVRLIFKLSKPPSPENQALLPCLTFLSFLPNCQLQHVTQKKE